MEPDSKNQLEIGKLVLEIESGEAGAFAFIFEQEASDQHLVSGISCDTARLTSVGQKPKACEGGMATSVWLHAFLQTALELEGDLPSKGQYNKGI